ncbi:MAG: cytidylyltransferase domain-containing protein [Escherichia coli]
MDVESLADIIMINSAGSLINIHLDFLQKKPWRQCHIIGSKGRIVWDLIRNEIIHHTRQRSDIIFSDPGWDKNGMYTDMLLDFIAEISGSDNNCVTLESSINIVSLIDKIKRNKSMPWRSSMKINAFIFARGGSKGLPGKNIETSSEANLSCNTLLRTAKQSPSISSIYVSTDDDDIALVAENCGATVIRRPAELAGDTSPEWLAWRHAIEWVQKEVGDFDGFVSLPTTSPFAKCR